MDDLTKEFLVESREGLERMERCLTELEARPDDAALLCEIFRAVHTIKGATGFLALPRLEKLAHAGEHLLGVIRDGKLKASPPVVDVLLELLDGLRHILDLIEATDCEGTRAGDEDAPLIRVLRALHPEGVDNFVSGEGDPSRFAVLAAASRQGTRHGRGLSDQTLRVSVETLNKMMNQVGELVLTRNQLLQSDGQGEAFEELMRRLDSVTAELQATVMHAHTQPVEHLFQKFPRMVRDVARQCGRNVRLDFSGEETRLDKGLLETVKDPITHAIRNAVDHGIEDPAERVRRGKSPEGVVSLRAHQEGGQIVIEVADDGGGIDAEAVVKRAVERGLISAERGRAMNEKEALDLIFMPGLSTRDEVTTVSGRGVGMDVVRANIENAGGAVEITSKTGEGSVLRMRVPLTLAIIPALVVRSGDESFLLPRSVISELVHVSQEDSAQMIEDVSGVQTLRWRDAVVPLVVLSSQLGLDADGDGSVRVAVVEMKGRRYGLVVDELLAPEEIVVKPISRALRQTGIFSGGSLLGNGDVALILDVAGIAARAQIELETMAIAGEGFDALVGSSYMAAA